MKFDFSRYKKELIAVIVVILGVFALYQTFVPQECGSFNCFEQAMYKCSPANYINEEPEASWNYRITGITGDQCKIRVTLLNAKEGELGLRELEGDSMECFYDRATIAYPEKNLDYCRGPLKEGLQEIVIDKLYKYIVNNLGEIREEVLFS